MRTLTIALVAAGLLFAAAPALAQGGDACKTSFTLLGKADSKWYLDGGGSANPTLTACPGQEITFTLQQEGDVPHNFEVRGAPNAPAAVDLVTGEDVTYKVTAPASGSGTYICVIHGSGMAGTLNFAEKAPAASDGGKKSPGLELVGVGLALVGAALLAARRKA